MFDIYITGLYANVNVCQVTEFVGFGRYGHTELPMRTYQNQHMDLQFQI